MTDKEKEILNGFLGKTLKLSPEVLASLYNEAGELTSIEPALEADAERITAHKTENKNQYNRGIKETATKFEKQIKEQFGIDSDKIGLELVSEVVAIEASKVTKSKGDIDDKHPKIIEIQTKYDKLLKDKDKEWEERLKKEQETFNKQKSLEKVKELAWMQLESKNPILPEDVKKAATWKNTFLREIEQGNYQINEDGTVVVLDKEGKPATDIHGHMISFNDYVVEQGDKFFEFPAASQQRSSATLPQGTPKPQTVKAFKDQDDYVKQMKEAKTPEERADLTKRWTGQKT